MIGDGSQIRCFFFLRTPDKVFGDFNVLLDSLDVPVEGKNTEEVIFY